MRSPETIQPPGVAVVTAEMGYGHLRAAQPLANELGVDIIHADHEPLATPEEGRLWDSVRLAHELMSRGSQLPIVGRSVRYLLDSVTMIPPLHPLRDLTAPNLSARILELLARRGMGEGLIRYLRRTGQSLLTTFYAPAIVADRAGCPNVFCVVTDADINRVWAPLDSRVTGIRYLAPTERVVRRLQAYGVPADNIVLTGFPLPSELLGGPELPVLRENLAARLVRLDRDRVFRDSCRMELAHFFDALPADQQGRAPLLTFAVGGAGAQVDVAELALPGLRGAITQGHVRLALVAGTRSEVAERFMRALHRSGMDGMLDRGIEILFEPDLDAYLRRFNELLARTDVLWTKPSELTFYAALGIPLILGRPVGVHERFNRRWIREQGVGLKQRNAKFIGERIAAWLADGTLAAAAWSGFMRLPKFGTYRIVEELRSRAMPRG